MCKIVFCEFYFVSSIQLAIQFKNFYKKLRLPKYMKGVFKKKLNINIIILFSNHSKHLFSFLYLK